MSLVFFCVLVKDLWCHRKYFYIIYHFLLVHFFLRASVLQLVEGTVMQLLKQKFTACSPYPRLCIVLKYIRWMWMFMFWHSLWKCSYSPKWEYICYTVCGIDTFSGNWGLVKWVGHTIIVIISIPLLKWSQSKLQFCKVETNDRTCFRSTRAFVNWWQRPATVRVNAKTEN